MNNITTGVDKIVRSLPTSVLNQKIHKTKVVFLDVKKDDKWYSKFKHFSANGNDYSVVDSEISYIPEEAYNALASAVTVKWEPKNRKQELDGIDGENPNDKYKKVTIPRFDLTIVDTFRLVQEDGVKKLISENETITKKIQDETIEALLVDKEKKMREEIEIEVEQRFQAKIKELEAKIQQPLSESDIDELVMEDVE